MPGGCACLARSLTIDVVNIVNYISGSQKDGLIRVDLGANNCAPTYSRSHFVKSQCLRCVSKPSWACALLQREPSWLCAPQTMATAMDGSSGADQVVTPSCFARRGEKAVLFEDAEIPLTPCMLRCSDASRTDSTAMIVA